MKKIVVALAGVFFGGMAAFAEEDALLRIERKTTSDRAFLIEQGVPLVKESESDFLAVGDPVGLAATLSSIGYDYAVIDGRVDGWVYSVATLRSGFPDAAQLLTACGQALWTEGSWVLIRSTGSLPEACLESDRWFIRPLSMTLLSPPKPPPPEFAGLQLAPPGPLAAKPMVQNIVNSVTSQLLTYCWDDVISSATTRYSSSAGCTAATDAVYNAFSGLGLSAVRQAHTSGQAPNVIGSLVGKTTPQNVYIIIGHVDDMPSSGAAPGADDNASGTAAVTAAAQAMAGYGFANTVKFIAVTGEEQGLYGSTYYAADAAARHEGIQGVLNGDMIAWAGDGLPSTGEDLDLDYNTSSQWLSALFAQCASDYGTGLAVKQLLCPSLDASDHAPFWDNGFSAVCGITDNEGYCGAQGSYPYYHTSSDSKANCGNTAFFLKAVKTYVATLSHLADPLCAKPGAPVIGSASVPGDNQITLTWSAGIPAGASYNVYRATGACPGGTYTLVKAGQTSSPWTDATVSGNVTYSYKVASVDATNYCESGPSGCASAKATGICTAAPTFSGVGSVTCPNSDTCTLAVSWGAATPLCSGPVTYNVYRSDTAPFTPAEENRIASGITVTMYTDMVGLTSGAPYHYIVRAVDASNGAEDANSITRSAIPMGVLTSGTWSDDGGDTGTAKLAIQSTWTNAASGGHAAAKCYATGSYPSNACVSATSPTLVVGSGGGTLAFWSKYDLEGGWDKGQVELSTDGGATFNRLPITAYPANSTRTGDACGFPSGTTYFTGTNTTYASFTGTIPAGASNQVRWRLSSDTSVEQTGWWIDDITITNVQIPGPCTTGSALPPGEAAPGSTLSMALRWSDPSTQVWPPVSGAAGYTLYRGTLADLPNLLTAGVESCTRYRGAATGASGLSEDPSGVAGRLFWYVVTAFNAFGEGSAGGSRIVNSSGNCAP